LTTVFQVGEIEGQPDFVDRSFEDRQVHALRIARALALPDDRVMADRFVDPGSAERYQT